jgi:anthranilate/para-aminobenzoate synthase component II
MNSLLLVDNGSQEIDKVASLFPAFQVEICPAESFRRDLALQHEIVVLSDGSQLGVARNKVQLDFARDPGRPILGLCYGFQIVSYAYGADLVDLGTRVSQAREIRPISRSAIFEGIGGSFLANEYHRYAVVTTEGYPELLTHATSVDGCEIIEVAGKKVYGVQFHAETMAANDPARRVIDNIVRILSSCS